MLLLFQENNDDSEGLQLNEVEIIEETFCDSENVVPMQGSEPQRKRKFQKKEEEKLTDESVAVCTRPF